VHDEGADLLVAQPLEPVADRDALGYLAERRVLELGLELRLAHQDDLQELLGGRLQVGDEAQVLQDLGAQVLGLVDEENHRPAALGLGQQEVVQRLELLQPGQALHRQVQLRAHEGHDLVEAERGVVEEDDLDAGVQVVHQPTEQRRLPRAHLAHQDDEALALQDAVQQRGVRLLVDPVAVEEARVGRGVEGLLAEAEVGRVHGGRRRTVQGSVSRARGSACGRRTGSGR
jgi:hypothetical protein